MTKAAVKIISDYDTWRRKRTSDLMRRIVVIRKRVGKRGKRWDSAKLVRAIRDGR